MQHEDMQDSCKLSEIIMWLFFHFPVSKCNLFSTSESTSRASPEVWYMAHPYRTPITTLVVSAGGTVAAGVGQALVHLLLTVTPHVALLAVTAVGLVRVLAVARVQAHFAH